MDTEKGAERWDRFQAWLNTPPAPRAASLTRARVSTTMEAEMARVGDQAAVLDAYLSEEEVSGV